MYNYEERNLKGFEGDEILAKEVERLIKQHGCTTVIETGTYLGGSTKRFAAMAERVITVEKNDVHFGRAKKFLDGIINIEMHKGDSVEVLKKVLPVDNAFFFLDAHWEKHCPLINELLTIADKGLKPVIAIHDFYVPGKPELGFDTYSGQRFDFEWIQPAIKAIYGEFDYHYNSEAEGAKRGVVFIYPK